MRFRRRGEGEMSGYIALLRKQPDSDFGVDFEDFPGCFSAGETPEDARRIPTTTADPTVR